MNTRTRHDTIIRTLRRTATATVDELAVEVGVSRRTMLRDICALRDQGFVIHSECGPGGGLQLEPQSVQTASKLSVVEVFAVLISVATMRSARTFPFSDLADSALAKIELALPSEKVRELRALLDCLHVGQLSP
ncbi:MAG: helix-turn-helix transcriptional regulator, partial [Hyphomonadaceae bacterium]